MEEETNNEGKKLNEVMTSDIHAPGDLGLPLAVLPPALGACSVPSSPCERDYSNDPKDLPPEIGEDDQINLLEEDILVDTQESDALLCENYLATTNGSEDDKFEIKQRKSSKAVPEAPSSSTNDTLVEDVIQGLCKRAHNHLQSNEVEKKGCCDCNISCTCCNKKAELIFKSIRRAKTQGWAMFKRTAFPLVRNIVRFVWIAFELITAVVGFALSIASTLRQDPAEIFNYVHLGLTALSIALAMVDLLTNLRCRQCRQGYDIAPEQASCSRRWCACCSKYTDIVRMLLAEALIYPLIVCDLFEIVTGRGFEGRTVTNRISFTLFILSCFSFVLYVFVARIVFLGGIIVKIQRVRMRDTFAQSYKETYSISALLYQLTFLLHLLFQMVTQVLALIAIGACIYFENRHFYDDGNTDTSIRVSAPLWAMMVVGYITPVIGFFSFFLVTYYWAQEFPVALCLDMISCWKMKRGPDDFINIHEKIQHPQDDMLKTISKFLDLKELELNFKKMHGENWCIKFSYPFRTPAIATVCTIYAILQSGFAVLAMFVLIIAHDSNIDTIGQSWFIYFCTVIGASVIANAYAFMVAFFWTIIFPTIVILVGALLVAIAGPVCVLICLGGTLANIGRNDY